MELKARLDLQDRPDPQAREVPQARMVVKVLKVLVDPQALPVLWITADWIR
jgi:hypothetical protein